MEQYFSGDEGAESEDASEASECDVDIGNYSESIFSSLTIEQLDRINSYLGSKGLNIMDKNTDFVAAYFSKVFSNELMAENQDIMTLEEKFETLQRLFQYAKTRKLPDSLVSNLLHEILALSIKQDDFKIDLFTEYIKLPLEYNTHLKKEKVSKRVKGENYYKWNRCLGSVQVET